MRAGLVKARIKKVLVLGGTSDARKVVKAIDQQGLLDRITLTYSVAGLVRVPELACEVISGGFSQHGGLLHYLQENDFDLVLDITHPFALQMSSTAVEACAEKGIQCWRFHRPVWQAKEGDNWCLFDDWHALLAATEAYQSLFLTAGQIGQEIIDQLAQQTLKTGQRQVLRTAAPPQADLPASMQWIKAIGPFKQADEKAILERYKIDLLISKNSGGAATEAKLWAARELGIPVFMLQRPVLPEADLLMHSVESVVDAVRNLNVEN